MAAEDPTSRELRRVGIDTGGTFTDIAVLRRDRLQIHKLPSTPADPGEAVVAGLAQVLGKGSAADVVHGTTVGLNAVLTGCGLARTAFVTNHGFEDLIEIGRQDRADIYSLSPHKPTPPVPRRLRFGVGARRLASGLVEQEPDARELNELCEKLARSRCESVAIGLLHAAAHPEDELRLAAAIRKRFPDLPITCSADLLPRAGEYERFSTAILNAALVPLMGRYVGNLSDQVPGSLRLLASSGGILGSADAERFPARAMFSGPAGGVVATRALAKRLGYARAAALDMGGTSADLCLVEPEMSQAKGQIAGLPLALPTEEVFTIGCGGGSLAWLDAGGALRVGPESAGADPGPACYGKGSEPTVTDAHVALGHLGRETLLGGDFLIEPERSVHAIEKLAARCGLSSRRTAEGILAVAETNMLRALLRITAERGVDPRQVPLVTYGGAGGLHAVALARRLEMPAVIVPAHPGAFSAVGLALAGEATDVIEPVLMPMDSMSPTQLATLAKDLGARAMRQLQKNNQRTRQPRVELSAALRFAGQGETLAVPWRRTGLAHSFRKRHQEHFGFVPTGDAKTGGSVELVELRARAFLPTKALPVARQARSRKRPQPKEMRRSPLGGPGLPCFERASMTCGQTLMGPALVEEFTTVTFVPPGCRLRVEPAGLILSPLARFG